MFFKGQNVADLTCGLRAKITEIAEEDGDLYYTIDPPSISDDYPDGVRTEFELAALDDVALGTKLADGRAHGYSNRQGSKPLFVAVGKGFRLKP